MDPRGTHRGAIAVVALLLLAVLSLSLALDRDGEAEWASRGSALPHRPEVGPATAGPVEPVPRIDLAPADRPVAIEGEADLDLPNEFRLHLVVQDWNGLPLPGAHVLVAPPRAGFCRWPRTTDPKGRVEIAVRGRAPTLELWVVVAAFGTIEPMRVFSLLAGRVEERVLAARGSEHDSKALLQRIGELGPGLAAMRDADDRRDRALARVRVDVERSRRGRIERRDEDDTLCGRSLLLFEAIPCGLCHTGEQAAAWSAFRTPPLAGTRKHPHGRFADLGFADDRSDPQREPDRPEAVPDRDEAIRGEFGSDRTGSVRGVVRNQDGTPVPGAVVAWLVDGFSLQNRARTDADGRYRLLVPAAAPTLLKALAAGLGHDEATVAVAPGSEQTQDFRLTPSSSIQGRAANEDGSPLTAARVEFVSDAEPGTAIGVCSPTGAWALCDVPRTGRLLLWPMEADLRLPALFSDSVLTAHPTRDLELRLTGPVRARLRIDPLALPPVPSGSAPSFEVRVLQLDTGCAAHALPAPGAEGFRLEGLAAGLYRIDVGSPGRGWLALGPMSIDGRGAWELGAARLPDRGSIRFVDAGESEPRLRATEFWLQREDTDVLVLPTWVDADRVELPPGTYALVAVDRDGRTLTRRVPVTTGREVLVSMPL